LSGQGFFYMMSQKRIKKSKPVCLDYGKTATKLETLIIMFGIYEKQDFS